MDSFSFKVLALNCTNSSEVMLPFSILPEVVVKKNPCEAL